MKPVYKCDYCDYMNTEDKVKEHEATCTANYDRRSCFTCKHKSYKSMNQFQCARGRELQLDQIWEFCHQYEREEKKNSPLENLFGSIFGGQ